MDEVGDNISSVSFSRQAISVLLLVSVCLSQNVVGMIFMYVLKKLQLFILPSFEANYQLEVSTPNNNLLYYFSSSFYVTNMWADSSRNCNYLGSLVFQPSFLYATGPAATAYLLGNTSGVSLNLRTVSPANTTGTTKIKNKNSPVPLQIHYWNTFVLTQKERSRYVCSLWFGIY